MLDLRLSYYNPDWSQVFLQERSMVWQCADGRIGRVEHIGGTSVPQLVARPLVDLVVELQHLDDLNEMVLLLRGIGYRIDRETDAVPGVAALLIHPRPSRTPTALWIVPPHSTFLDTAVSNRDLWREDTASRDFLSLQKSEWYLDSQGDQDQYERQKRQFFATITRSQ